MYSRTFWQDHVTEYDNRYREQNNPDGTISHIPVEGEIIQQGTPQNAANFNNLEEGIVAACEISAELCRIVNAIRQNSGAPSGYTDNGRKEIARRFRGPTKPDYGLGGGEWTGVLNTLPASETSEMTATVSGKEYEVGDFCLDPKKAANGKMIIRKED